MFRLVRRLSLLVLLAALVTACEQSDSDPNEVDSEVPGGEGGQGGDLTPDGGGGGAAQTCPHTFVYIDTASTPTSVLVAGEFTGWADAPVALSNVGDGFWTADVPLAAGRHLYKFVVDDQWIADPHNPVQEGEGDEINSVAEHTCPFVPTCILDSDCTADAPHCRNYACHAAPPIPVDCPCTAPEFCDADGACIECDGEHPCADPEVCRDNLCGPECLDDTDCVAPAICGPDATCFEPECAFDSECGDPMTRACVGELCIDRPCADTLFVFDPQGETYNEVVVAGDFNGWSGSAADGGLPMQVHPDTGQWWAVKSLDNGSFAYKFVADGDWMPEPICGGAAAECEGHAECVYDGFEGCNSVVHVDCAECTPETAAVDCGGPEWTCEDGICKDPTIIDGPCNEFDWADAVMYFVMVDRFYNSDSASDPVPNASGGDAANGASGQYEGGDLAGVTAKIPYLNDLGITAVWLSAPYDNRDAAGAAIDANADHHMYSGYHGYWPSPPNIDYSTPDSPNPTPVVESRIGTSADLHTFVDTAHDSEMMVLFDYVMNHVDIDSPLFGAHPDWFACRGDDNNFAACTGDNPRFALCGPEGLWEDDFWGTRCAFTDYLPPFDLENEAARNWSVADAVWWATEYGIDGYRLDAIKHVPFSWLLQIRDKLTEAFPEPAGGRFYLVGETFNYDNRDLLRSFVDPQTMLDGQFDFPFKKQLCEAVFHDGGNLRGFSDWMNGNDGFYGNRALMTTWIGNHDIPRAIHFANRQVGCTDGSHPGNGWTSDYHQPEDAAPYERLGVAFAVMMTNPGIPLIYYGDEVGLAGGGDPDNRRMMPWDGLNGHQRALQQRVGQLARIRRENPVLARGARTRIHADQHTWVYRMSGCGDPANDVVVAINKSDGPNTVPIPAGDYADLLNDGAAASGGDQELGPRSFLVYRTQ